MSDYAEYLQTEWERFFREPKRADETRRLMRDAGSGSGRVLDVGCGAGQELLPFLEQGWTGVGIDLVFEAGVVGQALYRRAGRSGTPAFIHAAAEHLPFATGSFRVVICRVALPYMDNRRAVAEMARVVEPGGLLEIKIHGPRYYWTKAAVGLRSGHLLSFVHASRVLVNGAWFQLAGTQPRNRLCGRETYLTKARLVGLWRDVGVEFVRETASSSKQTPSILGRKTARGPGLRFTSG